MQKNPENTMMLLDKVKTDINKLALPEIVNHPYIANQLKVFFGEKKSEKVINTFKSNYMVLVSDETVKKTLANADKFTVVQSLINLTKDNLSINPHDKESCIVSYAGKAVAIPMWRGKLKRMQETGVIQYLDYLECVYATDKFSNNMGKFTHEINYKRPDNDKIIGVLLVALMPDGRSRAKFVLSKDIEKRRLKSKMPNIWREWTDEMYKKTAITIFEGEIGKRSLEYSEQYETQDEDEVEEPVTVDQETEYVEEAQEAEEVPEVFQDEILRSQLDQLVESSGVLTPKEVEGLSEVIDTLDDTMLMKWISAINARVEKREKESAVVNKNEPPI